MEASCRVSDLVTELAHDIFKGRRSAVGFGLSGLSSSSVVRARLLANAAKVADEGRLRAGTRAVLELVDFETENDRAVREKCEAALRSQLRPRFEDIDALVSACDRVGVALLRLLTVQSVAARLGHWAPRPAELGDARTARSLLSDLPPPAWNRYGGLIQEAADSFEHARWSEAASLYFDADRMVRTATGLLRASVALVHCNKHVAALWAARVSLLEPQVAFETPGAHAQAKRLSEQLELLIDARQQTNLDSAEVEMLQSGGVLATAEDMAKQLTGRQIPLSPTRREPGRQAIPRRVRKAPPSTRRVKLSPPLDALRSDQVAANRPPSEHGEAIASLSPFSGAGTNSQIYATDKVATHAPKAVKAEQPLALDTPCGLRPITAPRQEAHRAQHSEPEDSIASNVVLQPQDLLVESDLGAGFLQPKEPDDTLAESLEPEFEDPADPFATPTPFYRESSELAHEVFDTIEEDVDPTLPLPETATGQTLGQDPQTPASQLAPTPEVFPFAALIEEARFSAPAALKAPTRDVSASELPPEPAPDLRSRPELSSPRVHERSAESILGRSDTRQQNLETKAIEGMDFSDVLHAEELPDFEAATELSLDTLPAEDDELLPVLDDDSAFALGSAEARPGDEVPSVQIHVIEEYPTPPPSSARVLGKLRYVPEPTEPPPPQPPAEMLPRSPLTRLVVRDRVRPDSPPPYRPVAALKMRKVKPLPVDDPPTETELRRDNVIPFPRPGSPVRPMVYEQIDDKTRSGLVDARGFVDVDTGQVEAVMRMMSHREGPRDAEGSVQPEEPKPTRAAKTSAHTDPFVPRNLVDMLVVYAMPAMPRATVDLASPLADGEEVGSEEIVFERRASSIRVVPLPDGAPQGVLIEVRQTARTTANLAAELLNPDT